LGSSIRWRFSFLFFCLFLLAAFFIRWEWAISESNSMIMPSILPLLLLLMHAVFLFRLSLAFPSPNRYFAIVKIIA
jgi:hypothetical protein